MDTESLLISLEVFGDRLFQLSKDQDDKDIESCPGWQLKNLVAHVGTVYGAVSAVINGGSLERPTSASLHLQKRMCTIGLLGTIRGC